MGKQEIHQRVLIPIEEASLLGGITEDELLERARIHKKHTVEILHMGEEVVDMGHGLERGYLFIIRGERELPDMKKRRALIKKVRRLGFLPGKHHT
jgi:hypothetical protein